MRVCKYSISSRIQTRGYKGYTVCICREHVRRIQGNENMELEEHYNERS